MQDPNYKISIKLQRAQQKKLHENWYLSQNLKFTVKILPLPHHFKINRS